MAQAWQTWKTVLDYIKLHLGADVHKLEFSDNRMIEIIKNNSLKDFSNFSKHIVFYPMNETHIIADNPILLYQFKDDFPYQILELRQKINISYDITPYLTDSDAQQTIDILIKNNYIDINDIVTAKESMKLLPPDKIMIIEPARTSTIYRTFYLEVGVAHDSPLTVDPGLFDSFKNLALADIKIFLSEIRSKFNTFNTPFGQVTLNAEAMKQEGLQLKAETWAELRRIPPDTLIYNL